MDISIVICTFNRSVNLPDCIEKLSQQVNCQDFEWEVVLVDNNSSDDTKNVVARLIEKHKINLRYVFEAEQGLSAARNKGIKESSGKYIIFIDDDIRVVQEWLSSIYQTFIEYDCDAVGGRIHVESPQSLPKWIIPDMYGFLGHRDFGDEKFQMNGKDEFPFGGNMALSRRIIEKIGMFDTRMGRKGEGRKREELFKGEETDYFHRLTEVGGTIYYEPRAIVQHIILPHQLEKKFFLTLHFNAGMQKAYLDNSQHGRKLAGVPLFIFSQTMRSYFTYLISIVKEGFDEAFRKKMNVFYFLGMILGYHKQTQNT